MSTRERLRSETRRRLVWLASVAAAFGLAHTDSPPLERFSTKLAQEQLQQAWRARPAPLPAVRSRTGAGAAAAGAAAPCTNRSCAVARLIVPARRAERIVVSHPAGRMPVGGWGHLAGTPLLATAGNTVFHIYRSSDARLVQLLSVGDTLVVELADTRQFVYRVETVDTADRRQVRLAHDTRAAQLTLIARHPDDARLRRVVRAVRLATPVVAGRADAPRLVRGA
ncbi:MAG: hypothetical protein M5U08_07545 [Burkholderiales bacterium]|nr:hypothetical protein [Burkholderiales bacterium]